MLSAHGYIEEEIPMSMHGFDPIDEEPAKKLIENFNSLKDEPININTQQRSFYLNKSILEKLLTETRNYAQFDCINFYFGVDNNRKVILFTTRVKGSRDEKGTETYSPVPMRYTDKNINDEYDVIEYSNLITNDTNGETYLSRVDINGLDLIYSDYQRRIKSIFQQYHPITLMKVPTYVNLGVPGTSSSSYINLPLNTLSKGYRIGKKTLRDIWQKEGFGSGIKLFLGYGGFISNKKTRPNLHIIAVGTDNPELSINDKCSGKIWATVDGSGNYHNFDGSSTCVGSLSASLINE